MLPTFKGKVGLVQGQAACEDGLTRVQLLRYARGDKDSVDTGGKRKGEDGEALSGLAP